MFEIRNATLPNGQKETILIGGSKIIVVNKNCRYVDSWIDGEGLLALPGLIDPHVHFRVPGGEHKEDWEHAVKAAIAGGVTTVFDMPNTNPPLTDARGIEAKERIIGPQDIDYRFWFGATKNNIHEIEAIAHNPRIIGVKVYMGASTGNLHLTDELSLLRVFTACAKNDLVLGVHAESEWHIRRNIAKIRKGRDVEISDHCAIRDTNVEVYAVRRALRLQQKTHCKVYFCHLSTPGSVELVAQAKTKGEPVYSEVCPHHLWLSGDMLFTPGPSKNFYKVNPPLREKSQVQRLRNLVCEGLVDTIGSDHAPHTREEKMRKNYDDIPSGMPGVETTFPLIFQFVSDGEMSIERFIDLTSANAATIFGLRHKGKIEAGNDADIVLVDPNQEVQFRHQDMQTKCGWTPFIAMRARGYPKFVISRGKSVQAR